MAITATAVSDDSQESGTVNVQVASKVAVDVSPADLSYTGSGQGSQPEPGDRVFTDDSGFTAVEVENIGSENITHVWMNNSVPTSNPFGTGTAAGYDAGNWIQINATGEIQGVAGPDDGFSYVTRKDFNESNDLSYISTPPETEWRYGRFRGGDQEYFWTVNVTEAGACETGDGDGDDFRVGTSAHNKTHTGAVDFDTGSDYNSYELTSVSGTSMSFADVSITRPDGSTRNYGVLVNCGSSTYTLRTNYNPQMGGATDLSFPSSNVGYLVNSTSGSEDNDLQPGEHFAVETAVEVPFGVASGSSATSGSLTVVAATQ